MSIPVWIIVLIWFLIGFLPPLFYTYFLEKRDINLEDLFMCVLMGIMMPIFIIYIFRLLYSEYKNVVIIKNKFK
jgi:hypothetical protein